MDWQGNMKNLRHPYEQIMGDLEAYKKKQADGGNGIKVQKIGIYFDDPNIIEDPS